VAAGRFASYAVEFDYRMFADTSSVKCLGNGILTNTCVTVADADYMKKHDMVNRNE
jgi:hypothetical protein